jgi:hypothetical protein
MLAINMGSPNSDADGEIKVKKLQLDFDCVQRVYAELATSMPGYPPV